MENFFCLVQCSMDKMKKKERWSFLPFFFSHVGRLARVLRDKGMTFFTLKNTSPKSA